ncbi:hypothetical protein, conserved [Trypanosoma brucei brucei TREU927]|uniref:Uncharacterized protein n=1 Tax=Trypanosoma brucei brucei (strain 927/4 GUTat10.1) TaxID=185431 RepID=Q38BF4_TRYB2|nr:hypothetical protein, conserved [Trypanosoma brucei brucei TREU927]EAN77866.1 hypothetical protein, conserved [Trypanosoma brucei brucei TREU927]
MFIHPVHHWSALFSPCALPASSYTRNLRLCECGVFVYLSIFVFFDVFPYFFFLRRAFLTTRCCQIAETLWMDCHFRQQLECAAQCIKEGRHNDAESIVRVLQSIDNVQAAECVVTVLIDSAGAGVSDDMIYVHFTSLRLLRVYLTRCGLTVSKRGKGLVDSLTAYAKVIGDRLLSPPWRPVLSETALDVAVILKLGCANAEGAFDATACEKMVSEMLDQLSNCESELLVMLNGSVVIHLIEEFGLYRPPSRGRGMSLKFHRECRSAFECDGLARFLNVLLCAASSGSVLSHRVLQTIMAGLNTALSWSHHIFFEEDIPEGDPCSQPLRVSGALWHELLVAGVPMQGARRRGIEEMLQAWYLEGRICDVPFEQRPVVELIREFCNIVVDAWDLNDRLRYGRKFLLLVTAVARDLLARVEQDEEASTALSLILSGSSSILENLSDIFSLSEIMEPFLSELSFIANRLIELDRRYPDNDGIMAALDEVLSCLFRTTQMTSSAEASVAAMALSVFDAFLSSKLTYAHSSDDQEHFTEAFTTSHITLVAHMGRQDPEKTTVLLCSALDHLQRWRAGLGSRVGSEWEQVQESMWVVLKLTAAFIADPCDGEHISTPVCFVPYPLSASHPALRLTTSAMNAFQDLQQNVSLASPAVMSALLDVLGNFITVYMHDPLGDNLALASACVTIIRCALYSLRVFAHDEDVGLASCKVLDASTRSVSIIAALQESPEVLREAEEMVHNNQQVQGTARGCIAAFCIACLPLDATPTDLLRILCNFDTQVTDFTSVDVDMCLERCGSLGGFLSSLKDGDRLVSCLEIIMGICNRVLSVSATRFYEKELAVRSIKMVSQLFLAYSPLLMDEPLLWLMEKVTATLHAAMKVLREDPTWCSENAEEEKQSMLKLMSSLLRDVAQWSMMESSLPPDVTHSLGLCVVSALATFLSFFDERCLKLPELKGSVLQAFQLCADAFTAEFVSSPDFQAFLIVLMFTLNSDAIDVQRIGTSVAETVVTFLHRTGADNSELFSSLLSALTKSFLSGKLSMALSPQVARCLVALCGCLPLDYMEEIIQTTTSTLSGSNPHAAAILRRMLTTAQQCSVFNDRQRIISLRSLSEIISESLCGIRGILLV